MIVLIKGIKFKVKLLKKKDYEKRYGKDAVAHVNKTTREIIFQTGDVKKNVVIHEVVHAFITGCHLGSCDDITLSDFEEIICEMMEDHLMDINTVSNEILKFLKEK